MSQYSFDDGAFRTLTFLYRITTFVNYFTSFGPLNGRNSHERNENIHLAFSTLNSNSRFDMNQISDMPSDVDDIARFRFEIDSKSKTFDRFVWYMHPKAIIQHFADKNHSQLSTLNFESGSHAV